MKYQKLTAKFPTANPCSWYAANRERIERIAAQNRARRECNPELKAGAVVARGTGRSGMSYCDEITTTRCRLTLACRCRSDDCSSETFRP